MPPKLRHNGDNIDLALQREGLKYLTEIRQAVPRRSIRGNGISVNSTLPPLYNMLQIIWHAILDYDILYYANYTSVLYLYLWYYKYNDDNIHYIDILLQSYIYSPARRPANPVGAARVQLVAHECAAAPRISYYVSLSLSIYMYYCYYYSQYVILTVTYLHSLHSHSI